MDYNILWFVLIVVLFTGFFFLEGFDYGVGTLLTLISDKESDRSQLIRSIGPVWDGNEVWMITAGGATFAAFPHVYVQHLLHCALPHARRPHPARRRL